MASILAPGTPIAYRPGPEDKSSRDPNETWFGWIVAADEQDVARVYVLRPDGGVVNKGGVSKGTDPGTYRANQQPSLSDGSTLNTAGGGLAVFAAGIINATAWSGFGVKNVEKHADGVFKFDFVDAEMNDLSNFNFIFLANAIASGSGGNLFCYPSSQGGQRAIKCEDKDGVRKDGIIYFSYMRLHGTAVEPLIGA